MEGGRLLSPSDLSYELRMPLSNVNYHVTELAKAELIELDSTQQVRGATEHFYRVVEDPSPSPRSEPRVHTRNRSHIPSRRTHLATR